MKTKASSIFSSYSIFSDFQTSLVKRRNVKSSQPKQQLNTPSLNKTSSLEAKFQKKIPVNAINAILNKQRGRINTNKPEAKANVNYPTKEGEVLRSKNGKVYQRNHKRNISSNHYQSNLNISLTNYTCQAHQEKSEGLFVNPSFYQSTDQQNTQFIIQDVQYNKDAPYDKPTDTANEVIECDSRKNTGNTFFTSGNNNEFTSTNTNHCTEKVLTFDKGSCSFIKNSLIKGLDALNIEVKERDKDKLDFLKRKYDLYRNALMQLGSQGANEEEEELIRMITEGMNSLMVDFNENKEKMNTNFSDLFHKYVEVKKENQDKSGRVHQLEQQLEEMQNTHIRCQSQNHESQSQKYSRKVLTDDDVDQIISSKREAQALLYNDTDNYLNKTEEKISSHKRRNQLEGLSSNYFSRDIVITNLESFYITNTNANNIRNCKLQLHTPSHHQAYPYKSNVPNLNPRINTWKNNYSHSKPKGGLNVLSNKKVIYNSNEKISIMSKNPSENNRSKGNLFINQCQSFLKMTNLNKMRKSLNHI